MSHGNRSTDSPPSRRQTARTGLILANEVVGDEELVDEILRHSGRAARRRGDDRLAGARAVAARSGRRRRRRRDRARPAVGSRPRSLRSSGEGIQASGERRRGRPEPRAARRPAAVPGRRGDHRRAPARAARRGSRRTCSSGRAARSTCPITVHRGRCPGTAPGVRDVKEVREVAPAAAAKAGREESRELGLPAADAHTGPSSRWRSGPLGTVALGWLARLRRLPGASFPGRQR